MTKRRGKIAPPTNQKARTTMDEELQKILKYLRLGGLLAHWDELLAKARRGRFSHERLLRHVLEAEYRVKTRTRPAAAPQTGPHPRDAGDRDVPLRPPAEAGPQEDHVALRPLRLHDQTAEHRLAGADRLRQERPGHRLPAASARSGISRLLHHLPRTAWPNCMRRWPIARKSRPSASTPATTAW